MGGTVYRLCVCTTQIGMCVIYDFFFLFLYKQVIIYRWVRKYLRLETKRKKGGYSVWASPVNICVAM